MFDVFLQKTWKKIIPSWLILLWKIQKKNQI